MRLLIIANIILVFLLTSCEEPYVLDATQSEPRVVIEGLVTDNAAYQMVRVTWSTTFYDSLSSPPITSAIITVSDNNGNVYPFVHNPGNVADSAGIYIPETPFAGVVGATYTLHVEVDGAIFEASDKLADVIPVDSLTVEIDDDEQEDPDVEGRFYEVLLFAQEPQNEKNFYLFKFYRNDSLTYNNETDIYFSDDELLAENIDGVSAPIYYSVGDHARVEVFSMSRQAYVYYSDLFNLLNGDSGGMFGPVPATPRTNLSNDGLGFFHVGAVKKGEIVVQ